jgi:hypothetical protein
VVSSSNHQSLQWALSQETTNTSYNPCRITPEEYFNSKISLEGRDISRPIEQTQKTQKFKAQLWLSENYPLSLPEQVAPIIDLMAASNAHFRKLKDFITLQLPAGFPVKIGRFSLTLKVLKHLSIIIILFRWQKSHCFMCSMLGSRLATSLHRTCLPQE